MMARLSEREIIKLFLEVFGKPPKKALPLGDDVSGVMLNKNMVAVLKVDRFLWMFFVFLFEDLGLYAQV